MILSTKCKNCGADFEYEPDQHGRVGDCPHCHHKTNLGEPRQWRPPPVLNREPFIGIGACYGLAVLFPLFGFFAGLWLVTRKEKESGHGCAVMAISIFCGLLWFLVFGALAA